MKKQVTLGLCVITNDALEAMRIVDNYHKYFDKFYITATTRPVERKLKARFKKGMLYTDKVEISYFKWVDHFGKARLFNQKQIKTDYWMWMDTDDDIDRIENLSQVMNQILQSDTDALYMNYDYYQNEQGEQQANHPRERILKTSANYSWANVPCHETVVTPHGIIQKTDLMSIKHRKSIDTMLASMERNRLLLEKDWKKNKDPRTAFYLGTTYEYMKKYKESIEMFTFLIKNGGWDEQKVIAWNHIADCWYFTENYELALQATDQAIHLDPTHPDAYYQKILIYSAGDQLDKACEWAEVALTKKPKTDTMQLVDPTRYTYKGIYLAAQSNLFLGRIQRAYELYKQVDELAPHFIAQVSKETQTDWATTFADAFIDEKAINYIKFLNRYEAENGGKPKQLFDSLPKKLFADARLNADRVQAIPPKKWPEKSIAIFCGAGMEPWGPDFLKDGMGGSEEAIIYLTRQLASKGWNITIYCERETDFKELVSDPRRLHGAGRVVTYKPWTEFNPWDEFDVFWSWRHPQNVRGVQARKKIVDLHDTMPPETLEAVVNEVDMFMVKSNYHRSLYPNIPDEKFTIVGNGIEKGHFNA